MRAESFPAFQSGHRHWMASSLGPNKMRGKKVGQWNRALGKISAKKVAVKHFGAASQLVLANSRPLQMRKRLPPLFCFRSKSGFGVSGSSPAQPFCSGILKPNAGKDSPTPRLGGGLIFR
jgi:hypothetical protein